MKSSPKAVTLLFLEDSGVAVLLAFCVDTLCRHRQSLTILGDHDGSGPNDFSRFLACKFYCIGVNALERGRIPIGIAGNEVFLAVVVGCVLIISRLSFRIRAFDGDLDALSDG